jgi:hypothetical protein
MAGVSVEGGAEMSRRLGLSVVLLAVLAAVPAALAAGPAPFASQGGAGVLNRDGTIRYLALNAGAGTLVEALNTRSGETVRQRTVHGVFGIPLLTYNGFGEGLSRDGRTLVVQTMNVNGPTTFRVLNARTLATKQTIYLRGAFSFDALSPSATRMYLVQRVSREDIFRYVVRAYDLRAHKLLRRRIADKAQASWVMQGYPATRVTSGTGRWVYTLYTNPGGYPFVHALDTVLGVAHCVGLPWTATNQASLSKAVLKLRSHSLVAIVKGKPWLSIDTATWHISRR